MDKRVTITIATAGAQTARRNVDDVTGSLHRLAGAAVAAAGIGGIASLATATVKWGLSFNAQVENARVRFGLFTRDVKGLTAAVAKIDQTSTFNFASLSDAAAMLGNSGVQNIPKVLQATANAAAASGKGLPALQGISIALAQIQAKGKLSQEEINQLNEAGAPHAQRIIAKAFNLTSKELQNLGGNGLDATKAVTALADAWTSGKMREAAEMQTKTLGGQWDMLTGNLQKLSGTVLLGLTADLEHGVLPALNKTATGIQDIFGQKGFSNAQKWEYSRRAIERNLGPIAANIWADIKAQNIPAKLGREFEIGMDYAANAAVNAAPNIVGKFVDAWLNAGPWAKLISGTWLANKLGLGSGIAKVFNAMGGGGGAAGLIAGRGSLANPMYVITVNGQGGFAAQAGKAGAKFGGLTALASGLGVAGGLSLASTLALLEGRDIVARNAGLTDTTVRRGNFVAGDPARQGQRDAIFGGWILDKLGINPAAVNGPVAPSMAGTMIQQGGAGNPFEIHTTVNIDGEHVARAVTRAVNKKKALK